MVENLWPNFDWRMVCPHVNQINYVACEHEFFVNIVIAIVSESVQDHVLCFKNGTHYPVRLDKFSRGSAVTQTMLGRLIIYPLVTYFL